MGIQIYFKIATRVGRSRHGAHFCNLNLTSISYSFWNIIRKVLKLKKNNWSKGRTAGHIFWKRTIQWLFHQNFVLIETRRFLWKFPIGSYVKLSSAVAVILVGVLKCRTQFWKRTTQELFQFGWDWLSSFRGEDFF